MSKLRVGTIHTLYGRRGGAEMLAEKLICGMVENFKDLEFIVYCNDEAFHALPDGISRLEKCLVPALNNQYTKALWLEAVAARVVHREGLDLFWIPSGTNSFPGRWTIPTVVTFLDLGEYFVKGKYDFKRTFYRKRICIPKSLSRGTLFTSISQATTADLTDLFGQESRVVYPGISPHSATSLNTLPKYIVRQETSADLDQIIFTPGRTDFIGKGLDVLLKAYAMLLQQEANLPPLVLVGPPGEGHERLQAELKRPELRGNVCWLGRVSNDCVDALYAMSKFVVFASRYEGFGFPVLEAMQHNAPLICSSAGSLAEVAGDAAYVVPPGDLHALAIAMQQLNRDDALRQTLVDKGKQRIGSFNWNATYEGMYRAFSDAILRQIRR